MRLTDAKEWTFAFRASLFHTVKDAVDVGGYAGGRRWKNAEPPRINESADP